MDFDAIIDGIKRWNDERSDVTVITELLNQGNGFKFTPQQITIGNKGIPAQAEYIHAYPSIFDGELNFVVINAFFDSKTYSHETIAEHCSVVPVAELESFDTKQSGPEDDEISDEEAIERIEAWDNYHDSWIQSQIEYSRFGIYQAFVIPGEDLQKGAVHFAYFALAELKPPTPITFKADLIIQNVDNGDTFEDFVAPVPPFNPGITNNPSTAKDNFYLLNVAEQ